jgi:hypothetical protein
MPRHKPADTLEIATAQECLRDALRFQLTPGYAALRPDDESVGDARKRFARATYSKKLDLICCASRAVCLALLADLDLVAHAPRVVEV